MAPNIRLRHHLTRLQGGNDLPKSNDHDEIFHAQSLQQRIYKSSTLLLHHGADGRQLREELTSD